VSRRVLQLRKLLENCVSVEAEWDPLLGGRETRAYRDLLGYSASKLVLAGAEPDQVLSYLGELFHTHGAELVDLRDALTTLATEDDAGGSAGKAKGGSA